MIKYSKRNPAIISNNMNQTKKYPIRIINSRNEPQTYYEVHFSDESVWITDFWEKVWIPWPDEAGDN